MTDEPPANAADFVDDDGPRFRYRREPSGLIRVIGEVDMATAEALKPVMLAGDSDVELDLSEVTFMDSSGVKLLLLASQRRSIRVVAVSPNVKRLLDLLGLADRFC